jgi:hypothetical protein
MFRTNLAFLGRYGINADAGLHWKIKILAKERVDRLEQRQVSGSGILGILAERRRKRLMSRLSIRWSSLIYLADQQLGRACEKIRCSCSLTSEGMSLHASSSNLMSLQSISESHWPISHTL